VPVRLWSRDLQEASRRLSDVYNSHRLQVVGRHGDFQMNLRQARVGRIGVATLDFGAEVEIDQSGDRPFCLVTTQVSGFSWVAANDGAARGGCGFIVLDNPGEPVSKRFSADSRRCNVQVALSALEAKCAALLQRPLDRPLRFSCFAGNQGAIQWRWFGLLQMLLGYAGAGAHLALIVQGLEESVLLHLLLEHQHSYSEALGRPALSVAPRHVRRAEEFMRAHVQEPLSLETLAREAGCSMRSLNDGFRKFRQMTPMDFLRTLRLEGVHAELTQAAPGVSVSAVALRWGFSHFGRFSAYYRSQFGELPSDTLRRQKWGADYSVRCRLNHIHD
jgi:AraC-like DNA-binding protein